ncbi:FAD binding domain-containing protein [Moorella sp. Hama-1]|nr:FAD binding domain-containing protein [Moorella sp. Hama-1]
MPGSFDYFRAGTIAEASAALKQEGAVALAGGTDLLA